jgi:hypothetical protein
VRRGLLGVLTAIVILSLPREINAGTTQPASCGAIARQVVLVLMDGLSYDEVIARQGLVPSGGVAGIGLMTAADDRNLAPPDAYAALGAGGGKRGAVLARCPGVPDDLPGPKEDIRTGLLGSVGETGTADALIQKADLFVVPDGSALDVNDLWRLLSATPADEVMLLVAAPVRSRGMVDRGDEATPLAVSLGRPDVLARECLPLSRCAMGLTSDTTRREGIVSNVDVAPTILEFLGVPIPEEMTGSPIRIEGEPPTDLHQRYLQYQRIHTPVGLLALALVLLTLFLSVGVLLASRKAPPPVIAALGILSLTSVALPVEMLPASLLPKLTYAFVLPTLAAGAVLMAVAASRWGRSDPARTVAIVAGLGMGVVIFDGLLGWPAMLTPLLGDSALEGVRFYGMGNAYAGVYMAGAILLAALIPPPAGMALLAATGLLAGLPNFGAELGTSFTLFAAAGLWYLFRVRRAARFRDVAIAAAIAIAGLATILLIHRYSDLPTHVTRVVEEAERSGPAELFSVFGRRLALNVRNTSTTPAAWLIVALLPVWLFVAWKRLGPFGPALRSDPAWRDAAIVLALSAVIGFLVNDSIGVAGLAFTFLSAALIYPALQERWKSRNSSA